MTRDWRGAVLFDLDGTLLDTAPDFARVLNGMRVEDGLMPLDYTAIRATVSNGARALITLAYGLKDGDPGFEEQRQRLLDRYADGLAAETRPFTGIDQLPAWCAVRNLAWGVVTNKPLRFTAPLLECMPLTPPPDAVICPDHVKRIKPDPEALVLACAQLGVASGDCVYVGDHQRDIDAGRDAGMTTIAVAWGYFAEPDELFAWGADHTVANIAELRALLARRFGA